MKLRIRGDSLRLRLTQTDVSALLERGRVEETTSFGVSRLVYALVLADVPGGQTLAARHRGTPEESRIEVLVSVEAGRAWAKGDQVGMEGAFGALRLLVEKDFACLTERPHEDDADAYPNPNSTC